MQRYILHGNGKLTEITTLFKSEGLEIMRFLRSRQRAAAGSRTVERSTRKNRTKEQRAEMAKAVLDMVTKNGPLRPKEMYTKLGAKPWEVRAATKQLHAEKKIAMLGSGKHVKYKRR